MSRNLLSGMGWLARGAAALAGLSVVLVVALVGALVVMAVLLRMFALPTRGSAAAARVLRGATRRVTKKRMAGRKPLALGQRPNGGWPGA